MLPTKSLLIWPSGCRGGDLFKLANHRVREIAYGFGGPSEKNVSPHYSQHGLRQICAVSRTIAARKLTN